MPQKSQKKAGKGPRLSKKFFDGNTINVQGQNTSTAKSGGGTTSFGVSKLVTPPASAGIVRSSAQGGSSGKPAVLCGSQQAAVIATSGAASTGDILLNQELRLDALSEGRLAIMSKLYSKWRIRKWKYSYSPALPSSTAGSLVMFIDPDPEDEYFSPNVENARIGCERKINVQGNVWAPMQVNYQALSRDRAVLFTNSKGTEDRFDSAGRFLVVALTPIAASLTLGTIMLDYEIEFSEENTQIDSLTAVSAAQVDCGGTFHNTNSPNGTTQTYAYNTIGVQAGNTYIKFSGLNIGDRFSILTLQTGTGSPTQGETLRNLINLGSSAAGTTTQDYTISTYQVDNDGSGLMPRITYTNGGTSTTAKQFFIWVIPNDSSSMARKNVRRELARLSSGENSLRREIVRLTDCVAKMMTTPLPPSQLSQTATTLQPECERKSKFDFVPLEDSVASGCPKCAHIHVETS